MGTKTKPSPGIKAEDPKALRLEPREKESQAEAMAHTSLRPTVQASLTLMDYNTAFGEISINTLVTDLGKQCQLVSAGDFARTEAMLIAQAHTLDSIFNTLARRAALNMGEYPNAAETYLRLALKAQSQCRTTLETLAAINNPSRALFVRQQNIGVNLQVNNGSAPASDAVPARESTIEHNELSEDTHELLPDTRASALAGRVDTSLETVGEINRTEDERRKG
jgi:hypothetical protein